MREYGRFINTTTPDAFTPSPKKLTPGDTNAVELVTDTQGALYVKKTPNTGSFNLLTLFDHVGKLEYPKVGFTESGGTVEFRSYPEQAAFSKLAAENGIAVNVPVYADKETLITPYTPGIDLEQHTLNGEISGIQPALRSLYDAHTKDIYMGDRWPINIIVNEESTITHIDFDIEIGGPPAAEFEIAQLLYAVSGVSSRFDETLDIYSKFSSDTNNAYDWEEVVSFMHGYNEFLLEMPKDLIPRIGEKVNKVAESLGVE
jgi:hypothetical protein